MQRSTGITVAISFYVLVLLHYTQASDGDFPGDQDEEEVHVYKKYARYPVYFYTYRSPHMNAPPSYQVDKEWNSGLDPAEADNQALSRFESLPQRNVGDQESFSKLQQILLNDLDPELGHAPAVSESGYMRKKKSSVSWLLAAAIRMCQKHPGQCLKKDMQSGKMDYKGLVEG